MTDERSSNREVPIWDLPVRLVHWSLPVLLGLLWWSAETHRLDLHLTLGVVMLGLVAFRLIWGLVGSSTARFAAFVRGPGAIIDYLRKGSATPVMGHNPLGALSVIVLLGLLVLQVSLGLVAQDTDGLFSGPLNHQVSYDTAEAATEIHEVVFNVILATVVLHLAAIAWYRLVRRNDLVRPMLTGRKALPEGVPAPRMAPTWLALVCALLATLFAVWMHYGAPPWGTPFPWDMPGGSAELDVDDYM
ncbi:MAG: cytochrome b/b6 domain-containing protein [Novosphingobium sp.]